MTGVAVWIDELLEGCMSCLERTGSHLMNEVLLILVNISVAYGIRVA